MPVPARTPPEGVDLYRIRHHFDLRRIHDQENHDQSRDDKNYCLPDIH